VLAHPGLITEEEVIAAGRNNVLLEITTRAGHSLANGHVAALARKHGVGMVIDTDSHSPSDLKNRESARRIVLGAGLTDADFEQMQKNAAAFL
jgi:histidinol phosphatase-like PHP family hydrolase